MFVSENWVDIDTDRGLVPIQRQAITWANARLIPLWNTLKWNLNQNVKIFFQENGFGYVVCKMSAFIQV